MDPEKAELMMAEVLAGERSPSDPEVQALLDAHPELADELELVQSLGNRLRSAGDAARADLAAAAEPDPTAPKVDIARLAREEQPRKAPILGWRVGMGLAAAAGILVAVGYLMGVFDRTDAEGGSTGAGPGAADTSNTYLGTFQLDPALSEPLELRRAEAHTWDLSTVPLEFGERWLIRVYAGSEPEPRSVVELEEDIVEWTAPSGTFEAYGDVAFVEFLATGDGERLVLRQELRLQP